MFLAEDRILCFFFKKTKNFLKLLFRKFLLNLLGLEIFCRKG